MISDLISDPLSDLISDPQNSVPGGNIEADDAGEAEAGQAEQEAGRRRGEVGEEPHGDRRGRRRPRRDQARESGSALKGKGQIIDVFYIRLYE